LVQFRSVITVSPAESRDAAAIAALLGKLLMRAIFETAGTLGCSRVEWTTDAGNTAAQAFYAKLGLAAYPSKIFYRVEGTGSGLGSIVSGRVS
jgi:hypothetical protein